MRDSYYDCYEDWGNNLDDWDGVDWSNCMSGPDDREIENQQDSDAEDWNTGFVEAENYCNKEKNISEGFIPKKIVVPQLKIKSFKDKKSFKIKSDLIFLSFKNASEYSKKSSRNMQRTFKIKRVGLVGLNKQVSNCWKVSSFV
jgi:hypothetical protein